ncbi:hypothetical protein CJI59_15160 [Streptomyces sp. Alain-F2R5]|nr:hypothetical protein B5181_09295 [Streptomyces sp. 4F]PAN00821.1 hypothetical protein CJI59_15160 [Streptomyces sp. Alain-F2R5]
MKIRTFRPFGRAQRTVKCVVPEKTRRFKPSKAFLIVILLAAVAATVLSVYGAVPPTVSVQVVAAVLASIEVLRKLTGWTPVAVRGATR